MKATRTVPHAACPRRGRLVFFTDPLTSMLHEECNACGHRAVVPRRAPGPEDEVCRHGHFKLYGKQQREAVAAREAERGAR